MTPLIPVKSDQVEVTFHHTRIANRAWATRRLQQLMDAVRISATVANPIGGQITMDVFCQPGCDATIATVYLSDFTEKQIMDFTNSMNRHRGMGAKIIKNIEHTNA